MTVYYLDSSVALNALLSHSRSAELWFDHVTRRREDTVVASRVLQTEMTRILRREGLPVGDRDAILDHVDIVPLTDGVLAAAEAIGPHVKTLDALHLGSVIATGLDAVIVTHDDRMRIAAESLGYRTFDPIGGS